MYNLATDYEVENFARLESRLMTLTDFKQYWEAYLESIETTQNYFDLGYFNQQRPFLEMWTNYLNIIKDKTVDLYGIFDGKKLLGIGTFAYAIYSDNGCHITIWIRSSAQSKGIGTYFLKRLSNHGLHDKGFRFAELMIDETNSSSRKMAEKAGYELMEIMVAKTQGLLGSGKYCRYICFDGEIDSIAENYHRQPIDLIDHPAYKREYRHLIHNKNINDYLEWPWPILNRREYQGKPFGLELDRLMQEALAEEEAFEQKQLESYRSLDHLNKSRLAITFNKTWFPGRLTAS